MTHGDGFQKNNMNYLFTGQEFDSIITMQDFLDKYSQLIQGEIADKTGLASASTVG